MPTENRYSNTEMVSVPPYIGLEPLVGRYYPAQCRRCGWVGSSEELTEDDAQCTRDVGDRLCLGDCDELERHDLLNIIQAMAAPQPHPDPIAWMVGTAFWWTKEEAERDAAETGLPIVGLGSMVGPTPVERNLGEPVGVEGATFMGEPNFRHSIEWYREGISKHWKKICDLRSEIERLRADAGQPKLAMDAACGEIAALRAYLAEAQALLREADEFMYIMTAHDGHAKLAHRYGKDWWDAIDKLRGKVCNALSASAEPSAPIAWHVGGNGYNRICFEEPTDLPGHPCIQAIHDQRQLIELLKRYDLRDEDVPPDERAHGIPGTSFQRLNALANQGE
ncbi:hypothetical protein [Pseudomonas sp. KCJK9111]|uniref:hypothetical protein n=1 Tax=Pseudomonas sp. KCJK9111 TaxID=3344555 RepID=UPI003905B3BE